MAQHGQDSELHKRKRDSEDSGPSGHVDRIPQPPPPQSGNNEAINYLGRASPARLKLIQGDSDSITELLGLINDYEGVLNRQESMAANLGAKLTGPRLLKAMEGVFEGPISATPATGLFASIPITWLDIVRFAKHHPNEFVLTTTADRGRFCHFLLNGAQVEITEDDWRLIVSGALDRFPLDPPLPFEEDEATELATLEILESRLQILIKKADEVAGRARQLNYRLSGRKLGISTRHSPHQGQTRGFQSVNQQQQRTTGLNLGYDLHAALLQQFSANPASYGAAPPLPSTASSSMPTTPISQPTPAVPRPQVQHVFINTPRPSSAYSVELTYPDEDPSIIHRPLITSRIERLARGEPIFPPCDRCRRLRVQCIKHLTACQGCTKKHAKCSWRGVTDEEIAWVKGEQRGTAEPDEEETDREYGESVRNNSFASYQSRRPFGSMSSLISHSAHPSNATHVDLTAGPMRDTDDPLGGRSGHDEMNMDNDRRDRDTDTDTDRDNMMGTSEGLQHEVALRNQSILSRMALAASAAAAVRSAATGVNVRD